MKLYEYKSGLIGDSYDTNAIVKRGKFILGHSSYKGGTTDYLNQIIITLIGKSFTINWESTKVTKNYPTNL